MIKQQSIYFFLLIQMCYIQAMERNSSSLFRINSHKKLNDLNQYYIPSKTIEAITRNNLKNHINSAIEISILSELERPNKKIDLAWNENIEDSDITIPLCNENLKRFLTLKDPIQKKEPDAIPHLNSNLLTCYHQLQHNTQWHYDAVTIVYVHYYLLKCMQEEIKFKQFIENPSENITSIKSIIQTHSSTLCNTIKWPTTFKEGSFDYFHMLLTGNTEFNPDAIRPFLGALVANELLNQYEKDINLKQKIDRLYYSNKNIRYLLFKKIEEAREVLQVIVQ